MLLSLCGVLQWQTFSYVEASLTSSSNANTSVRLRSSQPFNAVHPSVLQMLTHQEGWKIHVFPAGDRGATLSLGCHHLREQENNEGGEER